MPTPFEIQYYDHELQLLKHPWSHKIKKWLQHDCIEVQSYCDAICKPLNGYNTRTYKMTRGSLMTWVCSCQGYRKRGNCSHVEALKLKLKREQKNQMELFDVGAGKHHS